MMDILRHDLRLILLQLLTEIDGYTANDSVLLAGAGTLGHMGVSRSTVRGELSWLAEQGAITVTHPTPDITVSQITPHGHDLAKGRASHPDISRPRP